jgi:GH35 family endo-1,4-beta-xylanase
MDRKTRILALLLAILVVANIVVACGGGDVPPTQSPPATDVPAGEPTAVPAGNDPATEAPAAVEPSAVPAGEQPTSEPAGGDTPTTPPDSVPGNPKRLDYLEYGAAAQLYYTDRNRALTLMNNANFDWVRQQIHWKDIEGPKGNFGWGELDSIVADANAKNIKVMLSIVRAPSWTRADGTTGMPDNVTDMGDFVEALALRYKGKVQAYEIWNEQNLDHENGGSKESIDVAKYMELLIESYNRIKAVDPDAFVISGAPTSTGDSDTAIDDIEYFRQMFSYKDGIIRSHVDGIGFHPSPSYNPPSTLWPDNPGPGPGWREHPTHYFRHIENLKALMDEMGLGDFQVWVTEFGWATQNETPGYEYGNEISFDLQAEYVLEALRMTREEYPYVAALIIWNLNFSILWNESKQPLHEQASFSILNADWSPRPVYNNLQAFIGAVKTEEGR